MTWIDWVVVVISFVSLALVIAIPYFVGYREGWKVGYGAAYDSMVRDLREGKEMFQESGLKNWEVPIDWLLEENRGRT